MWGSAQPADQWVADFDSGSRTSVPLNGASAPVALAVFPNDRPFPTSQVPEALPAKVAVIEKALAVNAPDAADPVDVLAKVGGLEIAAMTGVFLGGAAHRVPVVMDGFISAAAALAAVRLCHECVDYILPSHVSIEIGHQVVLDELGLVPLFDLQMRLGEGTGAALSMSIIEAAARILSEMATFESAGVAGDPSEADADLERPS